MRNAAARSLIWAIVRWQVAGDAAQSLLGYGFVGQKAIDAAVAWVVRLDGGCGGAALGMLRPVQSRAMPPKPSSSITHNKAEQKIDRRLDLEHGVTLGGTESLQAQHNALRLMSSIACANDAELASLKDALGASSGGSSPSLVADYEAAQRWLVCGAGGEEQQHPTLHQRATVLITRELEASIASSRAAARSVGGDDDSDDGGARPSMRVQCRRYRRARERLLASTVAAISQIGG